MKPPFHLPLPALAGILVLLTLLSGCSRYNGTRYESALGKEINLVALGDEVAETLIDQARPPLIVRNAGQPILVATLVNNDNLESASSFGRSLQNTITAGFVKRGFVVKEVKLRRELLVEPRKGELLLSRELLDLVDKQRAQAVVAGTLAMANRVLYLSVRLVSPHDQTIRSVYEEKLTLDETSLRLLGFVPATGSPVNEEPIVPPAPSMLDDLLY